MRGRRRDAREKEVAGDVQRQTRAGGGGCNDAKRAWLGRSAVGVEEGAGRSPVELGGGGGGGGRRHETTPPEVMSAWKYP